MGLRSHTPKGGRARDKIVGVAEKLLAAAGFHGTSMRDVAAGAEVPLASVVYHFPKKEQLYGAVLARIGAGLEQELGSALAENGRGWSRRLDALVRALVAWTEAHPARVRLLLRELLDNPARVARASKPPLAGVLLQVSAFIQAGTHAGAFRALVPETAVLHLVGAVSYTVAAGPTVRRIVGTARARRLATSHEREAISFARRMFLALGPEVHLADSEEEPLRGLRSSAGQHAAAGLRSRRDPDD